MTAPALQEAASAPAPHHWSQGLAGVRVGERVRVSAALSRGWHLPSACQQEGLPFDLVLMTEIDADARHLHRKQCGVSSFSRI